MADTEPRLDRVADPQLARVLDELQAREPIFHRLELGTTRADFEAQTAPDFWEVGASGRHYTAARTCGRRWSRATRTPAPADPWETSQLHCRELGPDTCLLTYVLRQGDRLTRRATVWRRAGDGWQILYHQGRVIADAEGVGPPPSSAPAR